MKKDARIAPGDLRLEKRKGIPNPRPPQLVESLSVLEKSRCSSAVSFVEVVVVVADSRLGL